MEEFAAKPWVKALAGLVAAVLGLWLIHSVRAALAPFVIAFCLAYLLDPLIDRMERLKIRRSLAIFALLAAITLALAAFLAFAIPLAFGHMEILAKKAPQYAAKLEAALAPALQALAGEDQDLAGKLRANLESLGSLPATAAKAVAEGLWRGISGAMGIVVAAFNLAIIPVATFYLLLDFDHIVAWAAVRTPPRHRERVYGLVKRLDSALSGFFRGQVIVALIMAALLSTGLLIIGVPGGFAVGFIAGLGNIVPYMPLVIGYLPAMALAYASGSGWGTYIAVTAMFAAIQALEGFVITPKVQGEATGLHPVAIMAATLIGGVALGFIGVLLAAPAAAVIKTLLEDMDEAYMRSEYYNGKAGGGFMSEGETRP